MKVDVTISERKVARAVVGVSLALALGPVGAIQTGYDWLTATQPAHLWFWQSLWLASSAGIFILLWRRLSNG